MKIENILVDILMVKAGAKQYPLSKHHVYITVIREIRDMWGRCAEQIL